ncbi:MAG: acyl--CoA ligase [Solirubrobacteraceae bacterium]
MSSHHHPAGSPGTLLALLQGADQATAIIEPRSGDATSYGQLREAIEHIARQLVAEGVEPGDAVAIVGPNDPAFLVSFLAVVALGASAAPLNPTYTEAEFRSYLQDLQAKRVLVRDGAGEHARAASGALGIGVLGLVGDRATEAALDGVDPAAERTDGDPDSVALLLHTSGTTSKPKGVPLRQRNLHASARSVAAGYRLTSEDVSHCVMPLFHVHGLVASVLATFATGGTVLVPPRFSASVFWDDAAAHGMTWFSAVPTIHQILVRDGAERPADVPLRFARSCSSALAPTTWRACEDAYGVPVTEAYGMTEASHQMTTNPLPPEERRPGSVGVATGIEVGVVDERWMQLGAGTSGEVVVRGPSVVDGYRANPQANAEAFRDGWFRTGDLGALSEEGYLTLHGRIKELINRGGEKISPHEIEDALLSHPAVAEAVAFPEPDPKYGERVGVAAVLVGEGSTEDLVAHCAERLAAFKVPARIVLVDTIPKGPTGKVQRRRLADQLSP